MELRTIVDCYCPINHYLTAEGGGVDVKLELTEDGLACLYHGCRLRVNANGIVERRVRINKSGVVKSCGPKLKME